MPFSVALMTKLKQEAATLGLRSASAISVALREQLVGEKTGEMDGRARDYYVVARVIEKGIAHPMPGALKITGLDALSALAQQADTAVSCKGSELGADCAKPLLNSARASLTRNGAAHVVVILPTSRKPPATPDAWVDLFVHKTEADAVAKLATLSAGKVF